MKTTITRQEIQDRLQVTDMQIAMAESSGLIPESETGIWELSRIELLLNHWGGKLSRKRLLHSDYIESGDHIFPKHQR